MMRPLRLTVVAPTKTLLAAEDLAWVQVPLADGGDLGIYAGHAPLLAETSPGRLRYKDAAGEHGLDLADAAILHIGAAGVRIFTPGAAGAPSEVPESDETLAGTDFDRLANVLLTTLLASPEDERPGENSF